MGGMSDDPPGDKSPSDWSTSLVMPELPSDSPPGGKPPGDQDPEINLAEESFPSNQEFTRSDEIDCDSIDPIQGSLDSADIDYTHAEMEGVMNSTDSYDKELSSTELDQAHAEMEGFMNSPTQQNTSLDLVHDQMHHEMATEIQTHEDVSVSQASNQGLSQSYDL
jgi:hypothetical protein